MTWLAIQCSTLPRWHALIGTTKKRARPLNLEGADNFRPRRHGLCLQRGGKYEVYIGRDGKEVYLGVFDTIEEAIAARRAARRESPKKRLTRIRSSKERTRRPLRDRFVEKMGAPDPITGCQEWLGCCTGGAHDGSGKYGYFAITSDKLRSAHRVSHELFMPIPRN
jgi:hypothetical protein